MKIGFIGLGIMGEAMCANIIKKNNDTVYCCDLNRDRVKLMENLGGVGTKTNKELAEKSDVIISMVPESKHSKAVYDEILPCLNEKKICIDMSTIDPSVSVEISEKVKSTGADFADAPVVKSKPAAEEGKLGIYVGCDEELYEKIKPILSFMGENIIRMGENGMGLVMKVCHNALVSQIQNGVNETLILAQSYGVSVEDFETAVSYGGAQNFYLDSQYKNLMSKNWTTAFSLKNEHKDLGICENMAKEKGLKLKGLDNAKSVYDRGMSDDMGAEDFRATYKIVEKISKE